MYKYELHVHSSEASACALSTAREMVRAYKKAGYAGFVLTNHFIHGNTSVSRELPWEERMQAYYDAYLEAKDEGDKCDFDVFFGIEHHYEHGKEILIYGIDVELLKSHPELRNSGVEVYDKVIHEAGGVIVHAHPHRQRSYITPGFLPRYDVCDGIEVYNAADLKDSNDTAYADAVKLDKFMISGADVHEDYCPRIGSSGLAFSRRIRTNEELVEALLGREGKLIIDGKVVE